MELKGQINNLNKKTQSQFR